MKMPLSEFGMSVRIRLLEMGATQKWLVEEVQKKTGLYFDARYLYRILTEKSASKRVVSAIKEILEME